MPIYLSDKDFVERVNETRSIGKNAAETLTIIARYYNGQGYKKEAIREKLEETLLQCDPMVQLPKWQDTIDGIVRGSSRRPPVEIDGIPITQPEFEIVKGCGGKQIQRLAFTLLCVAKYWDMALEHNDSWVRTPDKEIMAMANINTSIKRQCAMMHDLREMGMITFRKRVDDLRVRVNYICPGEQEMYIQDLRNLGNQYMMHLGEPFIQCCQCGLTIRQNSNSQKYCPACATEIHLKQMVESVTGSRKYMLPS